VENDRGKATIQDISGGHGCPFCSGSRICCEGKSLAQLYPDVAAQWDYDHAGNNGLKPTQVSARSEKLVWWHCKNTFECGCKHSWRTRVADRTGVNARMCPWCIGAGGARKVCEHESFANKRKDLMGEWNYDKNDQEGIDPYTLTPMSSVKVWWKCSLSHSWDAKICNRARVNGSNCPTCIKYKQEEECREILETNLKISFPKV
jgi:hypothetical protein